MAMPSVFAQPVAFDSLAGFYHAADGDVAVLMVGAWGYEQFCLAKGWRLLGEELAAAGYPVLRYDHPGMGDSLDPEDLGLDHWRAGLRSAIAAVRRLAMPRAVVAVAHGPGAALVLSDAAVMAELQAVIALAPMVQGRVWLRELAAWSAMIGGNRDGERSIGGHILAPRLAEDMKRLDIRQAVPPAGSLLVKRPGRADEASLVSAFGASIDFEGYEAAVRDPTASVPPRAVHQAVIDHLRRVFPVQRAGAPRPAAHAAPARLQTDVFRETGLRFGPEGRLFGILTEPLAQPASTVLLHVCSARDPHIGWSRIAVDHARRLAADGYASFRFDISGNGETPPTAAHAATELLYSTVVQDDTAIALDWLKARGYRSIVLTGRCSGGFTALHAASKFEPTAGLVLVNILRYVWDPRENVSAAVSRDARPASLQARGFSDSGKLRAFLRGDIDRKAAIAKAFRLLTRRLPPAPWTAFADRQRKGRAMFRTLARRGARVVFVSGEEDGSIDRFEELFGRGGRKMGAYPGLSFESVPNADHNLNQAEARLHVYGILKATLAEVSGRQPSSSA